MFIQLKGNQSWHRNHSVTVAVSRQDSSRIPENGSNTNSRLNIDGNPITDSLSRISSFEVDQTVADKFEGVFYHVLPSGMKVNIQFSVPVLFNDIMGLLEKEFEKSSWVLNDKFTVTSHIQGKTVMIIVFPADKTIEVSGPGHKLWKEIALGCNESQILCSMKSRNFVLPKPNTELYISRLAFSGPMELHH